MGRTAEKYRAIAIDVIPASTRISRPRAQGNTMALPYSRAAGSVPFLIFIVTHFARRHPWLPRSSVSEIDRRRTGTDQKILRQKGGRLSAMRI